MKPKRRSLNCLFCPTTTTEAKEIKIIITLENINNKSLLLRSYVIHNVIHNMVHNVIRNMVHNVPATVLEFQDADA